MPPSNENHSQSSPQENPFHESAPPHFVPGAAQSAAAQSGSPVLLIVCIVLGVGFLIAVLCGGVLLALLLPAVQVSRQAAREAQSSNNAKQIVLAMHQYEMAHGALPPAYVPDENGNPSVSWRVLILPWLAQDALRGIYDDASAWDDAANRQAATTPLVVYTSPHDGYRNDSELRAFANYIVVTGDETLFPGEKPIGLYQIPDGSSNTVMLLEILDSDIVWTEPRDLTVDEILERVRQGRNFKGPNRLGNRVIIGLADGSVFRVSIDDLDPETLRKFLTRNGGENVDFHRQFGK